MSLSPAPLPSTHPLRLEYCEPGCFQRAPHNHVHRKSTPFSILLTVTEGSYLLENETGREALLPGRVAFIPAHTTTDFTHHSGPNGMSACWLHFRFSLYGLVDYLSLFRTPMLLPRHASAELIAVIEQAVRGNTNKLEAMAEHHLLASRALRELLKHSQRHADDGRYSEGSRLRPVLIYIQSNLSKPIGIDDLARIVHLSPSRFHALFSEEFQCSPMRYVKLQRLEQAARQLAGSDATLTEIASETGFADAFHLSHAFKAHYGVAPREYRRRARNWSPPKNKSI